MRKTAIPFIAFEATRRCQLSCLYCNNPWNATRTEMVSETASDEAAVPAPAPDSYRQSFRTLRRVFRQAKIGQIGFTGGEPTLAEGLKELVLFCRLKGAGVTLLSNGQADASEYADFARFGVSLFQFPLLSHDAATHDGLTGVAGSWGRSCAALKTIAAFREIDALANDSSSKIQAAAVFVLTARNADDFEAVLSLAYGLGARSVMIARYKLGGRGLTHEAELLPSRVQLHAVFAAAERCRLRGLSISSNVCVPFCLIDPAAYPRVPISSCPAEAVKRPVTIDVRGDIRLCSHSPVVAGNVFRETLGGILDSPYAKSWETTVPEFCRVCEKWERCRGGCRAASEQTGGGIEWEDPIVRLLRD